MKRSKQLFFLLLSLALTLTWAFHGFAAEKPFYEGKTIRLIIGTSAGGTYDLWARVVAPYLTKHIPGNPHIISQNMPGAGSLVAANYVYGLAKPDGLTLGSVNPALYFEQLIGRTEVQFGWAQFTWIGSPEQNESLFVIRTDTPYRTVNDLRTAKEPPKCGASGTTSSDWYISRLLEETLGVKIKIVTGYPGSAEVGLAILRGEVICRITQVGSWFSHELFRTWRKEGFVRALLQTGRKRDPRLPEVPTIYELMEQYKTPESGRRLAHVLVTPPLLGRPIMGPPGLAAERVKILREAYTKAMNDPELLAEAKKRDWEVKHLTGEELESLAKEVIEQPPDVVERMKRVLGN